MFHLACSSGSLRKKSYNTILLQAMREFLTEEEAMELIID